MKHPRQSLLFLAFGLFFFTACSGGDDENDGSVSSNPQNQNQNVVSGSLPSEITRLEFPKVKGGTSMVIVHYAAEPGSSKEDVNYSVEWDGEKKANRWSCYQMYANNRQTKTSRYKSDEDPYPQDPDLPDSYRWSSDPYWGSGYSHGHLCPSADRLYSYTANYQTFFLSNMSPQLSDFNGGVWETMENQLRKWITASSPVTDTLYVCKGGTIDNSSQIKATTAKGLIIPGYFFCALLMKNATGYKALGFWFEHKNNTDTNLANYVVNIDSLESLTGLDFFCNLPDNIENQVEGLSVDKVKTAWGIK